jgi:glycosyltransferase involved in cell wall biosynthesis
MVTPAGIRVLMLLQNARYADDPRVQREAETLQAAGYEVTVICPRAPGETRDATLESGVRLRRYRLIPTGGRSTAVALEWLWALGAISYHSAVCFASRRFAIIHAHNPPDFLVLVASPYKLLGCRIVYDHHDLVPEMFDLRFSGRGAIARAVLVRAEQLACRLADLVVEVNASHREIDRRRSGIPHQKSVIVRNGPDDRALSRAVVPPPNGRQLVIGYAGVIGHQDGVDVLVDAVEFLARQVAPGTFRCVVAGDGDARDEIQQDVRRRGLGEAISFTGWLAYPQFLETIESFDIGVAPEPCNSYNARSTLLKVMDYMALARPVVAFDLPEHRVSAGDAALYASGNTAQDLARAIRELIDDEELRIDLGRRGRKRVEESLAWSIVSQPLVMAYADLSRASTHRARCRGTRANRMSTESRVSQT